MIMNKQELIRKRAEKQLKSYKGGQILNLEKRVRKKKPYKNREYQAAYEYMRIHIEGPPVIVTDEVAPK